MRLVHTVLLILACISLTCVLVSASVASASVASANEQKQLALKWGSMPQQAIKNCLLNRVAKLRPKADGFSTLANELKDTKDFIKPGENSIAVLRELSKIYGFGSQVSADDKKTVVRALLQVEGGGDRQAKLLLKYTRPAPFFMKEVLDLAEECAVASDQPELDVANVASELFNLFNRANAIDGSKFEEIRGASTVINLIRTFLLRLNPKPKTVPADKDKEMEKQLDIIGDLTPFAARYKLWRTSCKVTDEDFKVLKLVHRYVNYSNESKAIMRVFAAEGYRLATLKPNHQTINDLFKNEGIFANEFFQGLTLNDESVEYLNKLLKKGTSEPNTVNQFQQLQKIYFDGVNLELDRKTRTLLHLCWEYMYNHLLPERLDRDIVTMRDSLVDSIRHLKAISAASDLTVVEGLFQKFRTRTDLTLTFANYEEILKELSKHFWLQLSSETIDYLLNTTYAPIDNQRRMIVLEASVVQGMANKAVVLPLQNNLREHVLKPYSSKGPFNGKKSILATIEKLHGTGMAKDLLILQAEEAKNYGIHLVTSQKLSDNIVAQFMEKLDVKDYKLHWNNPYLPLVNKALLCQHLKRDKDIAQHIEDWVKSYSETLDLDFLQDSSTGNGGSAETAGKHKVLEKFAALMARLLPSPFPDVASEVLNVWIDQLAKYIRSEHEREMQEPTPYIIVMDGSRRVSVLERGTSLAKRKKLNVAAITHSKALYEFLLLLVDKYPTVLPVLFSCRHKFDLWISVDQKAEIMRKLLKHNHLGLPKAFLDELITYPRAEPPLLLGRLETMVQKEHPPEDNDLVLYLKRLPDGDQDPFQSATETRMLPRFYLDTSLKALMGSKRGMGTLALTNIDDDEEAMYSLWIANKLKKTPKERFQDTIADIIEGLLLSGRFNKVLSLFSELVQNSKSQHAYQTLLNFYKFANRSTQKRTALLYVLPHCLSWDKFIPAIQYLVKKNTLAGYQFIGHLIRSESVLISPEDSVKILTALIERPTRNHVVAGAIDGHALSILMHVDDDTTFYNIYAQLPLKDAGVLKSGELFEHIEGLYVSKMASIKPFMGSKDLGRILYFMLPDVYVDPSNAVQLQQPETYKRAVGDACGQERLREWIGQLLLEAKVKDDGRVAMAKAAVLAGLCAEGDSTAHVQDAMHLLEFIKSNSKFNDIREEVLEQLSLMFSRGLESDEDRWLGMLSSMARTSAAFVGVVDKLTAQDDWKIRPGARKKMLSLLLEMKEMPRGQAWAKSMWKLLTAGFDAAGMNELISKAHNLGDSKNVLVGYLQTRNERNGTPDLDAESTTDNEDDREEMEEQEASELDADEEGADQEEDADEGTPAGTSLRARNVKDGLKWPIKGKGRLRRGAGLLAAKSGAGHTAAPYGTGIRTATSGAGHSAASGTASGPRATRTRKPLIRRRKAPHP